MSFYRFMSAIRLQFRSFPTLPKLNSQVCPDGPPIFYNGSILGAIAQALGNIGGYQDGNAGLMLSGYAPAGAPGQSSASRRSAIVMFARVMAQCPGACVAQCMLDRPYNKVCLKSTGRSVGGKCTVRGGWQSLWNHYLISAHHLPSSEDTRRPWCMRSTRYHWWNGTTRKQLRSRRTPRKSRASRTVRRSWRTRSTRFTCTMC